MAYTKRVASPDRLIKGNITLTAAQHQFISDRARAQGISNSEAIRQIVEAARQATEVPLRKGAP
jgi:hypothetical protein